MILEEVEAKLKEIDPNVYYGMVDKSRKETEWNYIVFNRSSLKISANKTGVSDFFDVHIIRENYIPEGLDNEVINKVCEISGVRPAGTDGVFNYVQKPNTNIVVEMLSITFVRARKANV